VCIQLKCTDYPESSKIKIYTSDDQKTKIDVDIILVSTTYWVKKRSIIITVCQQHCYSSSKHSNENNNKNAVINTLQTNKGNLCHVIPKVRIFIIVVIKFIAPKIDDKPAICKLKIENQLMVLDVLC
jgi:hypothetical protein